MFSGVWCYLCCVWNASSSVSLMQFTKRVILK